MTVLVDLGNTRLKWAVLRSDGSLGPMHAVARDVSDIPALRAGVPVLAVSVAKESVRKRFAAIVRKATGFAPQFVSSAARFEGLVNAYRDPWRLGADRWVAMVGARESFPRAAALLVVDVGTAATIDLLTRDGRHHGGLILPGPSMMVDSLLGKTAGIASRAKGSTRSKAPHFFARDTRAAIDQGARESVAATIERTRQAARDQVGVLPKIVLTGGGAPIVEAAMQGPYVRVDDLVLRGLACHVK